MDDASLLRYARHLLLDELGVEGQNRIQAGRILVIGMGGLGCPAALYLASAGVGELRLVDHDKVEASNLQRQVLYRSADIGQTKVQAAAQALHAINPDIHIQTHATRADATSLNDWVRTADVVLDCSDNFATRHAINQACVDHRKPLVLGAAVQFSGQLSVFDLRDPHAPCYHCLFPASDEMEEQRCATLGVFAPLTGIIGTLQAAQALQLLAGCGTPAVGKLLLFDALRTDWQSIRYRKDPGCPVCC